MQDRQRSVRPTLAATLCFAVLLAAAAPASAQSVSFAAPATFAVGLSPVSVAVGDFNGDSDPDLAVANLRSPTTSRSCSAPPAGASRGPTNFAVG